MSDIKLVRARVPVYAYESGRRVYEWCKREVEENIRIGKVASVVRRGDGAIRRLTLKAQPGNIASRSHRTATVRQDLPSTWSPNPRYYAYSAA